MLYSSELKLIFGTEAFLKVSVGVYQFFFSNVYLREDGRYPVPSVVKTQFYRFQEPHEVGNYLTFVNILIDKFVFKTKH